MERLIEHLVAAARAAGEAGEGPGQTAARLLRLVLDAAGAARGALLAFDAPRIRLVLAATRLDEIGRAALADLAAVPEVASELLTALRTGDPLFVHADSPLQRSLLAGEEPGTAALLLPLRAYRRPVGLLVLVGAAAALADGLAARLGPAADLLAHLLPAEVPQDGGAVLVDVEPVTTVAANATDRRVLVIDETIVLDGSAVADRRVLVELPDLAAARRLAHVDAPIFVNLAIPNGAEMIAAIRAAGGVQPATGYLANGGGGHATMLGPLEVTGAPFDPDEVAAAVERIARGTGAVLVVGCDSGAVFALRQTLARRRRAVRLAWDLANAEVPLAVGGIDVVVVDCNLPEQTGHRLVVDAARSPSRPGVVLVPGADPVAEGFAVLFAHDYPPLSDAPALDAVLAATLATAG